MAFILEIKGATVNLTLQSNEIISATFDYSVKNAKYAKSANNHRQLVIVGDILRTQSESPGAYEEIQKLSHMIYKDRSYYHHIGVTFLHRGELFREIRFPDAEVTQFTVGVNPHTGHGTYTMLVSQKLDLRHKIYIGLHNKEHPNISESWKARGLLVGGTGSAIGAAGVGLGAAARAAQANTPTPPGEFWINRDALVTPRIRTLMGPLALWNDTSGNFRIENMTVRDIPMGTELDVLNVITDGNITWFYASLSGQTGWIRERVEHGNTLVEFVPNDETAFVRSLHRNMPVPLRPDPMETEHYRELPTFGGGVETSASAGDSARITGLAEGTIVTLHQPRQEVVSERGVTWVRVVSWSANASSSQSKRSNITLLIDPGHGGNDYGAPARPGDINRVEPREKHLVLDFALVAQRHLSAAGYNIIMTRTTDVRVELNDRWRQGRDNNVNGFISIHFNGWAGDDGTAHGTETFYNHPRRIFDRRFAEVIHRHILPALGTADRGVRDDTRTRHGTVAVLREPSSSEYTYPRALIEIEFLHNYEATMRLLAQLPERKEAFARALVDAMDEYFKI